MLRRALRLYTGLDTVPLSYNEVRAATERLHRLLQHREWGRAELRCLTDREAAASQISTRSADQTADQPPDGPAR